MKVRNGFVSNSSSSSFLIRFGENFPDTYSIAKDMLKDKFDDWADFNDNDDEYNINFISNNSFRNLKHLKKSNRNTPIFFRSTNYDTYIFKVSDNYAFVDTCNNITWNIQNYGTYNIPPELNITDLYDLSDDRKNREYYVVEYGLWAYPTKKYSYCDKCYNPLWVINDNTYCLGCNGNIISRGFKVAKLKSILDNLKLYFNNDNK